VRDDVDRISSLGQIPADATVSGHVYDVRTGTLREVVPAEQPIGRDAPFSRSLGALAANAARAPREMFLAVRIWEGTPA